MDGPVARILKACAVGNSQFAAANGLSRGTMTYSVAGTYVDLPGRVVDGLFDLVEDKDVDLRAIYREYSGASTLPEAYTNWQTVEREKQAAHLLDVRPPFRFTAKKSPANFWVLKLYGSSETFAKALKVPPPTVIRWITGQTRSMPEVIERVLRDLDYPYLKDLLETQASWVDEYGTW